MTDQSRPGHARAVTPGAALLLGVATALLGACAREPDARRDATTAPDATTAADAVTTTDAAPDAPRAQALARGVVASYHAESTAAGIEILRAGGNAFDAFVAATFVDYVVAPGATSAAGPLGAILHVAADDTNVYLDADLNEVLDPAGIWREGAGNAGTAVNVPGAVAALAAISQRYGALPFARVLEPAIRAARDGFVVDVFYAGTVAQRADVLRATPYGAGTFFPDGAAVAVGSTLRLPAMAAFLEAVAREGAAHVYTGAWADEAVRAVAAAGGRLTRDDLARYRAQWREPRRTMYRGAVVLGTAGRAYGGLWAMVGLEVLEHTQLAPLGHYARSADALELVVRTARTLHEEPWFFDAAVLDDEPEVARRLAPPYTTGLWARVRERLGFTPHPAGGSHSYHVVVADQAGNVVSGTNTIEGLAFGEGLFVQGVPLNAAGVLTGYTTAPGERRVSPLSVHLALRDGRVRAALGAFGSSLIETEFAMLVDALDYGMDGAQIAASPRFGTFPFDWATGRAEPGANWLDPRVSPQIVETLAGRGLMFRRDDAADLGFGVALTIDDRAEPHAGAIRTYGHPVAIATWPAAR